MRFRFALTKSNNMLETLIAILIALGLNFSKDESGNLLMDSATKAKMEESSKYKDAVISGNLAGDSPIVVVPDIDPKESPIVVVPDIDPNAER